MNQFKNLLVWQKAIELVLEIYKITNKFPDSEKFGLTSQINRCTVSIDSNIAEGAGRNSKKEFNNFLGVASGSICELGTQLIISNKLRYLDDFNFNNLSESITEIHKMIHGLQKSIHSSINN